MSIYSTLKAEELLSLLETETLADLFKKSTANGGMQNGGVITAVLVIRELTIRGEDNAIDVASVEEERLMRKLFQELFRSERSAAGQLNSRAIGKWAVEHGCYVDINGDSSVITERDTRIKNLLDSLPKPKPMSKEDLEKLRGGFEKANAEFQTLLKSASPQPFRTDGKPMSETTGPNVTPFTHDMDDEGNLIPHDSDNEDVGPTD